MGVPENMNAISISVKVETAG